MNPYQQIAAELASELFGTDATPSEKRKIQAACEKAYQQGKLDAIKTTEYAQGWDDHVAVVKAATPATGGEIAEKAWDAMGDHRDRRKGIAIIQAAIENQLTQPKQIPLTNGQFATVDHQDFVSLAGITWHCTNHGRAATGKTNYMHKVIAAQMGITGEVDHIDGNPLNNRRSNLRGCTRTQNQANAPKSRGSTSQYKGVHWSESHGAWVSQIKHNEKVTYLGQFEDEMDAALTYDAAAKKEFGEFAKLNFPIVQKHIEKATRPLEEQIATLRELREYDRAARENLQSTKKGGEITK